MSCNRNKNFGMICSEYIFNLNIITTLLVVGSPTLAELRVPDKFYSNE